MTNPEGESLGFECPITRTAYGVRVGEATIIVPGDNDGSVRVNGVPIALTQYEQKFFNTIVRACGFVCTARMLLSELYPRGEEPELKILDVFAHHVRLKLGRVHADAAGALRTVWGRGYAFGSPQAAAVPIPDGLGLPQPDQRWVMSRKADLVCAVMKGRISEQEALGYYPDLSTAELREWMRTFSTYGVGALRTTRTQMYGSRMAA